MTGRWALGGDLEIRPSSDYGSEGWEFDSLRARQGGGRPKWPVARRRTHGAELGGELAQYEDIYRVCYERGPEGIIIGLAEQLS